jgi:hypothetical protein
LMSTHALRAAMFGLGTGGYRRQLSTVCRLASTEARAALASARRVSESWLSRGGVVTQETLLRLGTLAFAPWFYDVSTPHRDFAPYTASPLRAQPVFEICMRIPVDVHFDGGRIRGLARRAFADVVPEPILRRQWKDRPLSMVVDMVRRNLPFIRKTLLECCLVKERILDRAAVELALSDSPTSSDVLSGEVLSQLDLELWARNTAEFGATAVSGSA